MHLHVSNLTDFQLLKYDAFVVQEKVYNTEDSIKDVIKMQSVAAILGNIKILHNNVPQNGQTLLKEVITDAERVT